MSLYVMDKFHDCFTLRPSDLIATLTNVLMDNFCPFLLDFMCLVKSTLSNKYIGF